MTTALKSLRPRGAAAISLPSPFVSYLAACCALFAVWLGFYLFDPFGYDSPLQDTWHHVAVLRELMADPFTPSNPHLPTDEGSRYYTPLTVLAALAGRAVALSPYDLLGYIGAINLIGLAAGCWSFGRKYFGSPWAPLVLLASLLFAWGDPESHAGFHNYATWALSSAYPSSVAFVLGLFLWSAALDLLQRKSVLRLICFAMLGASVFLIHQLSGAIMIAGAGCFILFAAAPLRDKAICLAALGVGTLATLAWPYFDVIDVLASTSDDRWKSAFPTRNNFSTAMVAALIPLAGVIGFRDRAGAVRWELVAPTAVFAVGYGMFQFTGSAIAHRLPPAFILFAQLGLVWVALERSDRLRTPSTFRTGMIAAFCAVLVVAVFAAIVPRARDLMYRADYGRTLEVAQQTATILPSDSVSFATHSVVYPLQSTGRRVVSIPRPEPAAPSLPGRQQATDRFFDRHTSQAHRRQLISRWGATHAVFRPQELPGQVLTAVRALGRSRTIQPDFEVVTLAAAGEQP